MKKQTLNEQLSRIKNMMGLNESYEDWGNDGERVSKDSASDWPRNSNYADETFGDGSPESHMPDESTISQWIETLQMDKLRDFAGWEFLDTKVSEEYVDPYVEYVLGDEDGNNVIVIRFDAKITDSWPDQEWGLEQEPISSGYEMGISGIQILEPIKKYLENEEEKVFIKDNPKLVRMADDDISEITVRSDEDY